MNLQITNPPPDVSCIQTYESRQMDEINERLRIGWVLLGILISRVPESHGGFHDEETYILGLRRNYKPN